MGGASSPGLYVEPNLARYLRPADHPLPFVLHKDGSGTECSRLACGYLGCDARPFNPLLDALPAVIHARGQAAAVGLVRRLTRPRWTRAGPSGPGARSCWPG